MKALIVGGNSFLGRAVAQGLSAFGHDTVMTSRDQSSQDHIYFDLSSPQEDWPIFPDNIEAAFIATAITRQAACENDPQYSHFINVDQTLRFIDHLGQFGIHTIFPSTNIVLACDHPLQNIDCLLAPQGLYAEQKAEVENALRGRKGVTIVRFPKILDPYAGIIQNWKDTLAQGKTIEALDELIISPITLDYAAHFIIKSMEKQHSGLLQMSGDQEISYYHLAQSLAEHWGYSPSCVHKQDLPDHMLSLPRHPSLDCSLSQKLCGIGAQAFETLIEEC